MDTINKQDLGIFALDFLDNLTESDETGEYYAAIFIVADLDDEGEIRVQMRTSLDQGMTNIRVLQTAQLVETHTALIEAGE